MDHLPKTLLHNLDYFASQFRLKNYSIIGHEITTICIRFCAESHIVQGIDIDSGAQQTQYYRPKSSGALTRDRNRYYEWSRRKEYDSGILDENTTGYKISNGNCTHPLSNISEPTFPTSNLVKSELNANSVCFVPQQSTPLKTKIELPNLSPANEEEKCHKVDGECNTDLTEKLIFAEHVTEFGTIGSQTFPPISSVQVQTLKVKTSHHATQSLPITHVSKQSETDSSKTSSTGMQTYEHLDGKEAFSQTDPATSRHSQTVQPDQSSKCMLATPLRNKEVQTLSKKELTLEAKQPCENKIPKLALPAPTDECVCSLATSDVKQDDCEQVYNFPNPSQAPTDSSQSDLSGTTVNEQLKEILNFLTKINDGRVT